MPRTHERTHKHILLVHLLHARTPPKRKLTRSKAGWVVNGRRAARCCSTTLLLIDDERPQRIHCLARLATGCGHCVDPCEWSVSCACACQSAVAASSRVQSSARFLCTHTHIATTLDPTTVVRSSRLKWCVFFFLLVRFSVTRVVAVVVVATIRRQAHRTPFRLRFATAPLVFFCNSVRWCLQKVSVLVVYVCVFVNTRVLEKKVCANVSVFALFFCPPTPAHTYAS